MASAFDIKTAKASFPALHQRQVFFDNAGGSQTLGTVITSITEYLSNTNVQLGASYAVGKLSTSKYDDGFAAGAKYINATAEEIVFGSSTTQLFSNLSLTLSFPAGSELVLSRIDHETNIAPWLRLAASQNLVVKWWTPSSKTNPKLLADDLKDLLSDKTVLVAFTHVSNILGGIHDVKAIVKKVKEICKAFVVVDAVAYAPHRAIDVKELGVDFYAFSWYKVYGPHISMLYASSSAQTHMSSLGHYFNSSETLQGKLGLAGCTYELVQSIPAVVEYFGPDPAKAWRDIAAQEVELQGVLLTYLSSRRDITVYGETSANPSVRVPTVSFSIKGWNSRDVVERMDAGSDFAIRWGMFYSNRLVADVLGLGPEGIVRVSMVHYNSVDEISAFVKKFDEIVRPA